MQDDHAALERKFWWFWLGGVALLAIMIAMNGWLATDVSSWGIRDHQSAGTAARIDAIQSAWLAAGVMNLARFSIALDLIYIAVYSYGAYCGGRLFAMATKRSLRSLGRAITVAAVILALLDYAETISQLIQAMKLQGSDTLAGIAATAQPIKSIAFLFTFIGILVALLLRRRARNAT